MNPTALATLVGALVITAAVPARAAQDDQGCAPIAAAIEESGGTASVEQIAKKLSTDVETVRGCWAEWEASKKGTAPKAAEPPKKPY